MTTTPTRLTRTLAALAAVLVLCFSVVTPAQALAPIVWGAAEVGSFVTGVVIRAAGRQALTSVGVAASDAAWITRLASLANTVKTLLIGSDTQASYQYEIQAGGGPIEPPPLATPPTGSGSGVSEEDPLPYDSPLVTPEFTIRWESWMGNDGGLWNNNRKFTSISEAVSELNRVSNVVNPGEWVYRDLRTFAPGEYTRVSNQEVGWKYHRWGADNYYVIAAPAIIRSSKDDYGVVCPYPLPSKPPVGCDRPGNIHSFIGAYQLTGFPLKEGPDRVRRITYDGSRLAPDTADPDWEGYSPDQYKFGFAFTSKADPNTRLEVVPYKSGLSVTAATQVGPDVRYRRMELTSDGKLAAVDEATYTNENLSTIYTNKPGLLPYTDPNGGTTPGTGTGTTPTITFPDDYARENTTKSIATTTNDIKTYLNDTTGDLEDPPEPDSDQLKNRFFDGTFDNLLGWRLPPHTSQCPTASFRLWGNPYVVDSHCAIYQNQAATLSAIMAAVWVVLALFVVLKA